MKHSANDTRPAMTSLLIATAEVMAITHGTPTPAARIAAAGLAASGLRGTLLLHCARCQIGRALLRWLESIALPGIAAHYRWRKRRIEAWTMRAIDDGARQLIVLGAGFDALSARMTMANPSLRAFEIDRAASVHSKRRALADAGVDTRRISLLASDLDGPDALASLQRMPGFSAQVPTIVVAEGLLMYLAPDAATALCNALDDAVTAPLQLIGTAMDVDARGQPAFRRQPHWLRGWLRRRGEPFVWGAGADALPEMLQAMGMDILECSEPDDPSDPDPCPGEWLFRARLDR